MSVFLNSDFQVNIWHLFTRKPIYFFNWAKENPLKTFIKRTQMQIQNKKNNLLKVVL